MTIRLYNTMIRDKEELQPRESGRIAMYVCGPTTYNLIHLGNARPLVVFDTVRRYLEYRGFKVTFVQNFTDIDDKIINRSQEVGEDALALAKRYVEEFFHDADALNVRRADVHPKVSEHLEEIIAMIQAIIDNGYAYPVEGDVYFDVRKFPGYGKLSGRSLEEMQAGARVEVDTRKKDPMDFALWKAAKPGEPKWDSPWGPGRPGWHIECSAMSMKYLGPAFDIHGGGFDLIFPHHENEIAQSEAATGQPFARYWMHNGFITVNREKMSKSLGNFFTVRDILSKFRPDVVRFYLLSTHYRSPLDFDDGKLREAEKGLDRLKSTLALLEEHLGKAAPGTGGEAGEGQELAAKVAAAEKAFQEAMDDDFNTALAIATLFDLTREVNTFLHRPGFVPGPTNREALAKARDFFNVAGGQVLGIFYGQDNSQDQGLVEGLMELVLQIRQDARARKDWATSDRVRDALKELGIILEDTPQGPRWKRG